jgi:hypothetical protein
MQFDKVNRLGILGALCVAQADIVSRVINPPFYTDVQRLDDGSPYIMQTIPPCEPN